MLILLATLTSTSCIAFHTQGQHETQSSHSYRGWKVIATMSSRMYWFSANVDTILPQQISIAVENPSEDSVYILIRGRPDETELENRFHSLRWRYLVGINYASLRDTAEVQQLVRNVAVLDGVMLRLCGTDYVRWHVTHDVVVWSNLTLCGYPSAEIYAALYGLTSVRSLRLVDMPLLSIASAASEMHSIREIQLIGTDFEIRDCSETQINTSLDVFVDAENTKKQGCDYANLFQRTGIRFPQFLVDDTLLYESIKNISIGLKQGNLQTLYTPPTIIDLFKMCKRGRNPFSLSARNRSSCEEFERLCSSRIVLNIEEIGKDMIRLNNRFELSGTMAIRLLSEISSTRTQ